jgi:hypothetical protein
MKEHVAAQAREVVERGRGRGLIRPRKLGQMPSGWGNIVRLYQIISDFMTSSTRILGLYH